MGLLLAALLGFEDGSALGINKMETGLCLGASGAGFAAWQTRRDQRLGRLESLAVSPLEARQFILSRVSSICVLLMAQWAVVLLVSMRPIPAQAFSFFLGIWAHGALSGLVGIGLASYARSRRSGLLGIIAIGVGGYALPMFWGQLDAPRWVQWSSPLTSSVRLIVGAMKAPRLGDLELLSTFSFSIIWPTLLAFICHQRLRLFMNTPR